MTAIAGREEISGGNGKPFAKDCLQVTLHCVHGLCGAVAPFVYASFAIRSWAIR